MIRLYISLLFLLLFIPVAAAQENAQTPTFAKIVPRISLGLPIDCAVGKDCFVINYVDMGPEDGKNTDISCYSRTYDSHKGTDFAVLDEQQMKDGVNVLAVADGTVGKVRDGESDQWASPEILQKIKDERKECGNAIMIDHGEGLKTLYCHLKKGSIVVEEGQAIKKGNVIAQVGLSGMTEFPHVHLGIIKDNKILDPFTAKENTETCGLTKNNLWDNEIDVNYQQFFIAAAGFKTDIPTLDGIERDSSTPDLININSEIITFWMHYYGARRGDIINMEIRNKDGEIYVERTIEQDKDRASQFYFAGRKTANAPLTKGTYTGVVTITRQGKNSDPVVKKKIIPLLVLP